MTVDVILGLQWGDEGKGKIVDYLADQYDVVCRFQGGPNAGHTIKIDGSKYVLHTIPSGIFREHIINIIGNGVVLDPITFIKEITTLKTAGIEFESRLLVSKKAHIIIPTHRMLDAASEAAKGHLKIGSTLKGIGPAYMDKTGRNGLRIGDALLPDFKKRYQILKEKHLGLLQMFPEIDFDIDSQEKQFFEALDYIKSLQLINGEYFVNHCLTEGKKILAEGAQGSMLDVDFGTYPYVTSSNTITAGVCSGLGIAPSKIKEVIGIAKAYCTRVGSGPFPTELMDETGEKLRQIGMEFGATTGRPRRCGWIDIPQLKYTIMLNGVTQVIMTKMDVMDSFEEIKICTHYQYDHITTDELPYDMTATSITPLLKSAKGWNKSLESVNQFSDLPSESKAYVENISQLLHCPVSMVSTGPEREKLFEVIK